METRTLALLALTIAIVVLVLIVVHVVIPTPPAHQPNRVWDAFTHRMGMGSSDTTQQQSQQQVST